MDILVFAEKVQEGEECSAHLVLTDVSYVHITVSHAVPITPSALIFLEMEKHIRGIDRDHAGLEEN